MQDTYIFKEIPSQRPNTPLLDRIDEPAQLRELAPEQLTLLARELRAFLLWSVGQTGGHFGAGLGVIELTIALQPHVGMEAARTTLAALLQCVSRAWTARNAASADGAAPPAGLGRTPFGKRPIDERRGRSGSDPVPKRK